MKTKILLLAIFSLAICNTAEAQFLKKLRKKAEQAASETIMRKVEEKAAEKTENAMDTILNADKKIKKKNRKNKSEDNEIKEDAEEFEEKEISESENYDSQTGTISQSKKSKSFNSNDASSELPDQYEFNWEFKTVISSGKDDMGEINYLINSNTTDYFGMEMSSEELKGQGKMVMVMDNIRKKNVMFMDMNGQKIGQIYKMTKPKKEKNESTMGFKEIGSKEILGFTCYGIEVEDKNYIGNLYFTLDAPVNFSAFFAMANNKNAPKGFDPALLQVLKEDALLMEMTMTHKQKSKENFKMTPISLEKNYNGLQKKDYQFMKLGF